MPRFLRQDAPLIAPDDTPKDAERVHAERVLRDVAMRWQAGDTLEYRSRAILNHVGEQRLDVEIYARFRRPNLARLVFLTDQDEWSRVVVCDGKRVFDRAKGSAFRPPRTQVYAFKGTLLADVPHPLDDTGYFTEQFLSPSPLIPPPGWGEKGESREVSAVRYIARDEGRKEPRFRLTFTSGTSKDTVILNAITLAPLRFSRVAAHNGVVQEILREEFDSVRLAPNFLPSLFEWTNADEQGKTIRVK